jgi:glycine/sarcosine/betaine reductase complex component A
MDLHNQATIKELAEKHGSDSLLVILGSPDPDSAALSAETVVSGDPTYAGPLAEVQLGLDVYHILEDEVRSAVPAQVWEEQIGVMAEVLDAPALAETVSGIRGARTAA